MQHPQPLLGQTTSQPRRSIPVAKHTWRSQKNPRAHKKRIGTSPPKKKTQIPAPPPKRGILWAWRFSCRKKAVFSRRPSNWRSHFRPPELRAKHFKDTRIFMKKVVSDTLGFGNQKTQPRQRQDMILVLGSFVPSLCVFDRECSECPYLYIVFLLLLSCSSGSAAIRSTSSQSGTAELKEE